MKRTTILTLTALLAAALSLAIACGGTLDLQIETTPAPTTPPRKIVLAAPEEDTTVTNPVEVRGRVSVMPFEGNLRGRVYDAQGQVVGEAPIQAQPDTEGELGGPGTFAGTIPFQVETSGPGRVEIAEISARDGSVVVSATAAVTLTETPPPDLSKMDIQEWSSTSPDGSLRGPEHCHLITAPPSEASTSTPAPLESLTVFTAAGLTIEEYAVVSATVDAPKRFEFMDRVPEDVLARRAAWRDFDTERRLSRLNEALAPFDCRLTAEETAEWRGVFYDFYCEDREILSNLRRVWSVSVNASGTDFAFVAENAPNKSPGYLLVQKDTVHPLSDWGYVVPVYRGDELLTLERLGDGQFAVKQGEEVLYTYRDRGIRADRPIKRLLTEGENWILEARGEVIVNGESLNQRLDVDEIFHYIILQGQPLFFFERGSQVRVSYGGETLPVVYDEVVHYQCCEPAMFNVRSNEHMLWFYALREGIWHYVEIGSYTDD